VTHAVVLVVPDTPRPGVGGPSGLCYFLLDALIRIGLPDNVALYCLSMAEPRCYRITTREDVQSFISLTENLSPAIKIRSAMVGLQYRSSRWLRGLIEVARATSSAIQLVRLRPIMERLLEIHDAIVFHSQTARAAYKVIRVIESCARSHSRIMITDHSKGGELREYTEIVGPKAVGDWHYRTISRCYEVATKAADTLVFPSRGALQLWSDSNPSLAPIAQSKSVIIYNGVPKPETSGCPINSQNELRLFAVAEHVPEKGLDRLLRGVAELRSLLPQRNIKLRIAGGQTKITADLESMRRSLKLDGVVEFLGRIPHNAVLDELTAARIVVGMPRVVVFDLSLLEAMALGKPIVTSNLPGNVEALGDGYPLLVRDEHDFAHKVALCDHRPDVVAAIGGSLRDRYERLFTAEEMAKGYRELYGELLGDAARGRKATVIPAADGALVVKRSESKDASRIRKAEWQA
jgi:glycosyltransferase involved in cell wall biosynthesis